MKKKKIHIKMNKKVSEEEKLLNNIDLDSLKLFREMMSDRFKEYPDSDDQTWFWSLRYSNQVKGQSPTKILTKNTWFTE